MPWRMGILSTYLSFRSEELVRWDMDISGTERSDHESVCFSINAIRIKLVSSAISGSVLYINTAFFSHRVLYVMFLASSRPAVTAIIE